LSRVLCVKLTILQPSQGIPHLSYHTKLYRCVHNCLPLVPFQSYINPVYTLLSYSSQIHSLLSYVYVSASSTWSFSTDFPTKTLYAFPFFPVHATGSTPLILFPNACYRLYTSHPSSQCMLQALHISSFFPMHATGSTRLILLPNAHYRLYTSHPS